MASGHIQYGRKLIGREKNEDYEEYHHILGEKPYGRDDYFSRKWDATIKHSKRWSI